MYIDKELLIADGLPVDALGDNLSDPVDLSVARNVAKGKPLYLVVVVDEDFVGAGSEMQVQVITATDDDLTTGRVVLVETPFIDETSLTAGRTPIVIALPPVPESGGAQQYLGANFLADNAFGDSGAVTAFFTSEPESNFM